jgi:hypothetical protein
MNIPPTEALSTSRPNIIQYYSSLALFRLLWPIQCGIIIPKKLSQICRSFAMLRAGSERSEGSGSEEYEMLFAFGVPKADSERHLEF